MKSNPLFDLEFLTQLFSQKEREIFARITALDLEKKCTHYIEVKVNDANKTAKVLEKELGCKTYQIVNDKQIKIFNFNDDSNKINRILLKNNIDVYSLEMSGIKLEEYFLNLIGGKQYEKLY